MKVLSIPRQRGDRFPYVMTAAYGGFVRNRMDLHDPGSGAYRMISAIIRLAESLELSVVAEGVESTSVRDTWLELVCREVQGYLLSVPLGARETYEMIIRKPRTLAHSMKEVDDRSTLPSRQYLDK